MNNFKVAYRKTKKGSVIKVREYICQDLNEPTNVEVPPQNDETKFQYPKHLLLAEIKDRIETGQLLAGKFQASRENNLEGHVAVTIDREDVHVLIQGRDSLNRAIHEDEVVIELLPRSEWKTRSDIVLLPGTSEDIEVVESELLNATKRLQSISSSAHIKPTGKVVAITKRVWRQYTGVLRRNQASLGRSISSTRCLFVPSDRRIPIIRIETRQYDTLKNQRLVVAIDSWPRASRYPLGHYVKSLGNIGDKDTENQVLLLEHDIPHLSFTDAVLNCLPPDGANFKIPQEEFLRRVDLRKVNICSVDPPGCTDIDDALHYIDLDKERCQVGVHIADVSYFVKPGTPLDQEAANRGTTVYLSDRRIDMIPDLLSSNLCSLKQNQDRLAFSAIWTINKLTADVIDVKFHRSIINSKASLTYEKAQSMIDDKSANSAIHQGLRGLNNLAKKLKQKRLDRGALVLARADEIRFVEVESETHEKDSGLELQQKKLVDTNSMVEEFMLLANIAVAQKLLEVFPENALLRRHPKPSKANFDDLLESAKVKGFEIKPESGKSLSESLDRAKLPKNEFFNLMLRMIATRCMTPAAYFCSGHIDPEVTSFTHFGLAADLYTHFTSPIRRYADLLVHRLLACSIGISEMDSGLKKRDNVQLMCDQINYRHRMAQLASRASLRLHTVLYIKSKMELLEEAYVFFVRQNAVQILIPRIAFEYTYFLQPSEDWQYDVSTRCQKNAKRKVTLKQFDRLKVHVSVTTKEDTRFSDKIQVRIIDPKIDDKATEETPMDQDGNDRSKMDGNMSSNQMLVIEDNLIKMLEDTRESVVNHQLKKKIRLELNDQQQISPDAKQPPRVLMPGDVLEKLESQDKTTILGPGLMRHEERIVAMKGGLLKSRGDTVLWLDCHQKRYVAVKGDYVIGIVRSKASLHARIDVNTADLATLSLLAFEGSNKRNKPNLNVGDLIYAKVLSASKHVETELVCVNSNGKRDGLGVIGDKGGLMMSVSIDTVRVLLAPQCEFLERLGQKHRYEIALGMNGRIWINSSDTSTLVQIVQEIRKFDVL